MNHILLKQDPNIGSPKIRPNESPVRFPMATGKSKLCYERAVYRALYNASDCPIPGVGHKAVRFHGGVAIMADRRLFSGVYA